MRILLKVSLVCLLLVLMTPFSSSAQQNKGNLFIIGLGPAGPELLTRQAYDLIQKMDAFILGETLEKGFVKLLKNKKILFNPYEFHPKFFADKNPNLNQTQREKKLADLQAQKAGQVLSLMNQGKNIAYLCAGDPNIFSSWSTFLPSYIPLKRIKVIPGVSSFSSAVSALKKNIFINNSVVITTSWHIRKNESLLKALAKTDDTLALFMSLKNVADYMPIIAKYYPQDTPCHVVYYAGYKDKEKVLKTTVKHAVKVIQNYPEKFMGIVFVGPYLEKRFPANKPFL